MKHRNKAIDFWKFIFAAMICIHHSRSLRGDAACIFLGGSIGVEFFFIVSGYLMLSSFERREARGLLGSTAADTVAFMKNKLRGLLPNLWVALVISYIVREVLRGETLKGWLTTAAGNIYYLIPLDFTGLGDNRVNANPATWYLSAMLLVMLLLYPLLHKYKDMFCRVWAPTISMFLFGYLFQNFSTPRDPNKWLGLCYKGFLRGMADICLGIVCYMIVKRLSQVQLTKFGRVLCMLTELVCYLSVIYYGYRYTPTNYDYIFILITAIAVSLSFSGLSAPYIFLGEKFTAFLGEFSYSLYLGHYVWSAHLGKVFPSLEYYPLLAIYLGCSLVTALIIFGVSRLLKKHGGKLTALVKKVLVRQNNAAV